MSTPDPVEAFIQQSREANEKRPNPLRTHPSGDAPPTEDLIKQLIDEANEGTS